VPFARITRYALLLAPLLVCAARLYAQGAASPATTLQETNRCLGIVRASSKRRQRDERSQRTEPAAAQDPVGNNLVALGVEAPARQGARSAHTGRM
jgi:hypothetical protein